MNASKTIRWIALTGLSIIGLLSAQLALAAGPAGAFTGYGLAGSFGAAGTGNGQLREPAGVAVNNSTKEVYVYDSGNLRVERFDSTGAKFEGQFNGSASLTGVFTPPASISEYAAHGTLFNLAVDNDASSPSAGDVYVVDPGHNVIDKFSATGAYLSQLTGFKAPIFGVAVDTAGNVWVEEEGSEAGGNHGPVQKYDNALANKHLPEIVPGKLRSPGIALDSEQNLYLLRGEPAEVVKFNKEGTLLAEIAGSYPGTGLAINSATDELLVDQKTAIARFGPFGTPFEETITGLSASYGVAVDASTTTKDLYASQREASTVAIFKFGLFPDVTTGVASEVQSTAAKLSGEVNPDGVEVTSCELEYGTSEAYGQSVPCTSLPGSGSSPAPVSAEPTGLTAQTAYHFRLVAGNTTGSHAGLDATFTTPPAVENVVTGAATEVLGTSAKLGGSFEPNGFDTHYVFEYGLTAAFGFSTPSENAGSATENKSVGAAISGLTPNQSYHFRIAAENTFGKTTGEEQTFTTPVVAPAIPGNPSASFIAAQSADVSAALNPQHTTTNYHFEYGPCPSLAGCAGVQSTAAETSAVYGQIGVSAELAGLAPATTYSYRLLAVNEFEEAGETKHDTTTGTEGTLTTGTAHTPSVQTGSNTVLGTTSAVISGSVEPNGVPTSYSFELGVYNGASTQYGVVSAGTAGAGEASVPVSETLAGLQPGATYAYRLSISSGYLLNETHTLYGATGTFTTTGLPSVLSPPTPLAQLPIPPVAFPKEEKSSGTSIKTLTNKQKLTKALALCKKKKGKQRASCERNAHKRYGR